MNFIILLLLLNCLICFTGLLGNFVTWEGFFDVSKREGFKKQNTYYDESTIKPYPEHKWMKRRL